MNEIKKIEIKVKGKWKSKKETDKFEDCEAVKITETINQKEFKINFPKEFKKWIKETAESIMDIDNPPIHHS